jgi:hypothetical protein
MAGFPNAVGNDGEEGAEHYDPVECVHVDVEILGYFDIGIFVLGSLSVVIGYWLTGSYRLFTRSLHPAACFLQLVSVWHLRKSDFQPIKKHHNDGVQNEDKAIELFPGSEDGRRVVVGLGVHWIHTVSFSPKNSRKKQTGVVFNTS